MIRSRWALPLAAVVLGALSAQAKVEPATIFADNMVLQQGVEVPVWGKADPGESVTVNFAGQSVSTTADADGKWMVKLAPMTASAENRTLEIKGASNTVTANNTLVGEVWLCSGQSNMEMPMWTNAPHWRAIDGDKHVAAGANPLIRTARMVPYGWSGTPRTDFPMKWEALDAENGKSFSATAFYFGQELQKALGIPIGLVTSHWGGTRIEPWTPPVGFDSVPELRNIAYEVNAKIPGTEDYKQISAKVSGDFQKWLDAFNAAVAANEVQPQPPEFPNQLKPYTHHQQPTVLYNRMIFPFVPFAFRGAIWYQGCSNLGDGMRYRHKMQALYNGWKEVFNNPDLKFYFVQLAPYNYGSNTPSNLLPEIWEAQQAFAEENGDAVGMAVINDVGNLSDIHPHDKQTVGKRLALLALNRTYGKSDLKADSPVMTQFKVEGNAFVLDFKNVESWNAKGDVVNFEIAGADGAFHPAQLEIRGTQLVLTSPEVTKPFQLRYMWKQTAEGNLFNEAGLPLGAFRCGSEPSKEELIADLQNNQKLVYEYDLKTGTVGDRSVVNYITDNSAEINGRIKRITYLVELTANDGKETWAAISMDAFTSNARQIGVPTKASGAFFATRVNNMVVRTNAPGVQTGFIAEGNIEFWSSNYSQGNKFNVPGANGGTYDFGDDANPGEIGYGSMQIHNYRAKQTIFAYNNFSAGGQADLGLGNAPGNNPDWTFTSSAKNYSKAILRVYVDEIPAIPESEVQKTAGAIYGPAGEKNVLYVYDLLSGSGFGDRRSVNYNADFTGNHPQKVKRVGYLLNLIDNSGKQSWVYTEMDSFTPDGARLGVPTAASGAVFQTAVKNLEVASNVPGVKTGTFPEGFVEFWSSNYRQENIKKVPEASNDKFDFGDAYEGNGNAVGYGSMQIHNPAEKQTVFAYNKFDAGRNSDLGIGNNPDPNGNPDWTFSGSAKNYKEATLYVLADLVPEPTESELQQAAGAVYAPAGKQHVLYAYDLRSGSGFGDSRNVRYEANYSKAHKNVKRVAYLLDLTDNNGQQSWVYAAMDSFSPDAAKVGVPTPASGAVFQTAVKNLEVASNVPDVKTGTFPEGFVEFWSSDYQPANAKNVAGASNDKFDFGDTFNGNGIGPGYGSMQVHNPAEKQTVFAYNNFRVGPNADLGIGNNPDPKGNPDWTFSNNAKNFRKAMLYVLADVEE